MGEPTRITVMVDLDMADEISRMIRRRQERFSEDLDTSIKVVLLNYGDGRRIARCMGGDWSGPKAELIVTPTGLPGCPMCGRGCTEDSLAWRLALAAERPGDDPWGLTEADDG